MPVMGLGYIGLEACDLDAWRRFGIEVLAMRVIECGVVVKAGLGAPLQVTHGQYNEVK